MTLHIRNTRPHRFGDVYSLGKTVYSFAITVYHIQAMLEDTIIAVSTAPGYGGLGVVRLSGDQALPIAKKIFAPKKASTEILPSRPLLGYLFNRKQKERFETAYLTFFPAPDTYTREDVVEISCHGSPVILEETVRLGVKAGARHARPGEFTLRAYLHGRIDILQAEAINDMIMAPSLVQAKISFRQMEGDLSKKIRALRNTLIHLLSQIEATIEFPDEGLKISSSLIQKTMANTIRMVDALVKSYDFGKTLSEGTRLAITGRTNVGKSTLFNALLDRDRAIVTPYPGTTRDYLSEQIKIQDSIFSLVDMAGMGKTTNRIEKAGIRKGQRLAQEADGILLVLDASQKETDEDISLIKKFQTQNMILLLNKTDLPKKMDPQAIQALVPKLPVLEVSALKRLNLKTLEKTIVDRFIPDQKRSKNVILHLRQKLLLQEVRDALQTALKLLKDGYPEEMSVEEVRRSLPTLGELIGDIRMDDVLADIFNRFCVGK
jgi:tRNA modification GTPase